MLHKIPTPITGEFHCGDLFILIYNFVQPPVERVLGRYDTIGSKGEMVEKTECCYDVPLLDSLQSLLQCPSVVEQVCM